MFKTSLGSLVKYTALCTVLAPFSCIILLARLLDSLAVPTASSSLLEATSSPQST